MSDPFLGEIRMVGFNFAPRGWALCQGQVMSIAQNSALFSLLGTLYGGNGQVTFGLPDYRGRSPVGQGQGPGLSPIDIGEVSGTENVTILSNQMPAHTHTATPVSNSISASGQASIPAATTGTTQANPGPTTVLGPIAAAGRAGSLYATGTPDTTLAPFNVSVLGDMPGINIGISGGSQPLAIRNPFLGTNFVIALEGIFPSRN
ncbi:tail fiber protein [Pseudomonas sp. JS3066]|jgi:microcystin-dependent protein|uniref:phage tail protein n=1 Tax=unclassified Pseudomonas TaxID=196821 RepID=UPI00129EB5E6|nr:MULTISPECIES: tail fiber protein [unclassified Pseudomonas]MDH4655554.1 phage tail protein [Pseudomonas sp. BN606]MRK19944.1 phage tail protein [Pseudomonas sp. JG-B]WVK94661.1 tail fiber protein [Pseudomonas sp. JS3066]